MLDQEISGPIAKELSGPPASRLLILTRVGLLFQSSLEEEWIRHVLLSACTAGEGLGFNRAILLSYDKEKHLLEGVASMGHLTWEETQEVWKWISDHRLGLDDFLSSHRSDNFQYGEDLIRKVREIRIPLDGAGGIAARTFVEKRTFQPDDIPDEESLEKPIRDILRTIRVATCPLVCQGEALGAVVVDNRFTGKPISKESIQMLSILCNQAAGAIRNARLYAEVEELNTTLQNRIFAVGEDLVAANEELRRSNEELRNAQAELIRKDRLAFLGEMAAIVAHEIRNPLTSIRGFAERIQRRCEGADTGDKTGRDSGIIMEEVDRLHRVLGDVLNLARRVSPRVENGNINRIVRDSLRLVSCDPSKMTVVEDLSDAVPDTLIDVEQIKQVFLNLFRNALQAMQGQGRLTVRTRVASNYLEIEVADTGPGIPEEIKDRIFQPFFSTKPQGTGLGLSLVQRIVEDHRGKVSVESEPGKGATFLIRLPIVV